MGGEGSMAAANNSLKLNRSQLSKRKDRKSFEGSYANVKMREFSKATPEQLRLIKQKMQLENKRIRKKRILFFSLTVLVLVLFLVYVFK